VTEIKRERIDDTLAIRYVNDRAFGRPNEGRGNRTAARDLWKPSVCRWLCWVG
jgi:hypothetical protein